jgi:hypothetical protein
MLVRHLQHYLSSAAAETKGTETTLGTPEERTRARRGASVGRRDTTTLGIRPESRFEKGDQMRPHCDQDDEGAPLCEGARLKLGLLEGGEEGCAESHWATKMASSNARQRAQTVDLRKAHCSSSHRLAGRRRSGLCRSSGRWCDFFERRSCTNGQIRHC